MAVSHLFGSTEMRKDPRHTNNFFWLSWNFRVPQVPRGPHRRLQDTTGHHRTPQDTTGYGEVQDAHIMSKVFWDIC